jgi:hypothetical protein
MCCAGAFRHPAPEIQEYATGMQEWFLLLGLVELLRVNRIQGVN